MDRRETIPGSGSEDDRGQLAECLAFISDIALSGDAEGAHRADVGTAAALPDTCAPTTAPAAEDSEAAKEAIDDQVDEETVPEPPTNPSGSGGGRARWLRHRLRRLRLQRQRSAPGAAALSASVDDSVSSHIQMLNSLDSQVRHMDTHTYTLDRDIAADDGVRGHRNTTSRCFFQRRWTLQLPDVTNLRHEMFHN